MTFPAGTGLNERLFTAPTHLLADCRDRPTLATFDHGTKDGGLCPLSELHPLRSLGGM